MLIDWYQNLFVSPIEFLLMIATENSVNYFELRTGIDRPPVLVQGSLVAGKINGGVERGVISGPLNCRGLL